MKRFLGIGVIVAMLALTAASAAAQPRFTWTCEASAGGMTNDRQYTESGPYLISISRATVLSINRRVGSFEGQHGTAPQYVPCAVAESVAYNGMHAFDYNWSGISGWMGAGWTGAANGPWFGSFYCAGDQTDTDTYAETCRHRADRHAGQIIVKFTITAAAS